MHSSELTFHYIGDEFAIADDAKLLVDARAGSHTAFAELHGLYARRLYRTIYSITKNHEDAEDALQDTLLRAYLALDSFQGRSQLLSWLTRIAINTSLMTLRKRRVRRTADCVSLSCGTDGAAYFELRDSGPNPEDTYLQLEKRRRVNRALTGLSPESRTLIQIATTSECSLKEIASSLDVSVATVKSKLHRARRQLATRIHNQSSTRACSQSIEQG